MSRLNISAYQAASRVSSSEQTPRGGNGCVSLDFGDVEQTVERRRDGDSVSSAGTHRQADQSARQRGHSEVGGTGYATSGFAWSIRSRNEFRW